MVPSRVGSSSSGIFFQGGNSQSNLRALSGDVSNAVSVPSISLVTDANSHSSNISGSCVVDGSSNMQPTNQGSSCSTSQLPVSHMQNRPRLDIKPEGMLHQQLLQRQDSMHLHTQNPHYHALIQQQRLRLLQSMNPMQRAQLMQQQQIRQQQPVAGVKRPFDGGVCSRRLMQYLYHQRQRPSENTIAYWRKFVAEYYSPRAKKRWCLSQYDNVGHHSLGVFPQASMDAWQCDICGSKSGKGFEATFEVLPRLNEIKFGSGVIDELLFLDLPREQRYPSGMILEYAKAVQETIYEQLRVVREGQLRIVFTPDLKIFSWEFCARRHEELLPRRLVAPQVNQLLQVAEKCQSTVSESGPDGISQQDVQANSVMVVTAGRHLAKSLDLQSLNDLGFSKRYVRCLQIAEAVNSMKDLMDFSTDKKVGPIEGLKSFPRVGPKVQKMQEVEMGGMQCLPTDRNSMSKLIGLLPGPNSLLNNQHMVGGGPLSASGQSSHPLNNYPNLMTRQNSMNSTHSLQHEPSSPFSTTSNQPPTPRSSSVLPGTVQNSPQLQTSQSGNVFMPQNQSQPSNQALQQHMIQQLLHDMNNKKNATSSSQTSQNPVGNVSGDRQGFRTSTSNMSVNVGNSQNGSSTFKTASNSELPVGSFGFGQKSSDITQNLNISDIEMVQDVVHEFTENGFFSNDLDENFSWKD